MSSAEDAKEEGNAAWKRGDHDKAIECFTRAIEIAEEKQGSGLELLHIYYSNRSATYLMRGAFAAALLDAEKSLKLNPTFAKGWGRKGAALLGLHRQHDAVEAYTEGVRLDSSNQELKRGLDNASRSLRNPSASTTASAGQGRGEGYSKSTATLIGFVQKNKALTVLFTLRTLIIGGFMLFMVPFISGGVAFYKRALLANLALIVASIYINHGRPRFCAEYGCKLLADSNMQQFFPSLLFLFQRPYLLGVAPIVMVTLVQWLWFFSCMLQVSAPNKLAYLDNVIAPWASRIFGISSWRSLSVNARWLKATHSAAVLASQLEVAFGLLLVVELLLPRRNFITTMIWWQQLRMRCMLETSLQERGQTPHLRNAFGILDNYIFGCVNHPRCPLLVRTGYGKIRDIVTNMGKVPDPNAAGTGAGGSSMTSPRCSIM
eukprot:343509_1